MTEPSQSATETAAAAPRQRLTAPDAVLELADIQQLMTLPAFRRFMARASASAGILQTTHGSDARHSAYREGRRHLGLELLDKIAAATPGGHLTILAELVSTPKEPKRDRKAYDPHADIRDDEPASD